MWDTVNQVSLDYKNTQNIYRQNELMQQYKNKIAADLLIVINFFTSMKSHNLYLQLRASLMTIRPNFV